MLAKIEDVRKKFIDLRKLLLEREFEDLNPSQRAAVFALNGSYLILAGAGSGKTTVIVKRILNLINFGNAYHDTQSFPIGFDNLLNEKLQKGYDDGLKASDFRDIIAVDPVESNNILAITFTNKAADELKSRISLALRGLINNVHTSTFHSLCVQILRMYTHKTPYSTNFSIYDADDQKKLIKDCIKTLNIDEKLFPIRTFVNEISNQKNKLISHKEYSKNHINSFDIRTKNVALVYELYQNKLMEIGAMDYDDLLFNTVKLLKENPDILANYRAKFKYIMVDEYQDTNYVQNKLIEMLAGENGNICVVGDDDQSIYKFRGADVSNILNFGKKFFKNTKIMKLEQNYRSTKTILEAANSLVKNNPNRHKKALWTDGPMGEKIHVHMAENEHDEIEKIIEVIKKKVTEGANFSDFAILYRVNFQSHVMEKLFHKHGIPYRLIGGTRFFEHAEIKDLISYLTVINNPKDEVRLRRIINVPRRAIGDRTIQTASEIAVRDNLTLFEVIKNSFEYEELHKLAAKVQIFSDMMCDLIKAHSARIIRIVDLLKMVIEQTGYYEYLKSEYNDSDKRIENVRELIDIIESYEASNPNCTLSKFLEDTSLITELDNYDETTNAVVLMTVHSAKGLEFNTVFLPGFEDGIFPSTQKSFSETGIEEERRLAYVAITRARKKLYIYYATSRMIYGTSCNNKPSRFLKEIPQDLCIFTKSKDWEELKDGSEKPQSINLIREKSKISATKFAKIVGGEKLDNIISKYNCGERIRHRFFGEGEIKAITKVNSDTRFTIQFGADIGIKELILNKFVKLEKIEQ